MNEGQEEWQDGRKKILGSEWFGMVRDGSGWFASFENGLEMDWKAPGPL